MKNTYFRISMRLGVTALALTVLYSSISQAEEFNLGDCLQSVEAYDHAIVESHLPESATKKLEAILNNAVTACEAGNFSKGSQHIKQAEAEYETLINEGHKGLTDADFWQKADWMWGNKSYNKGVEFMYVKVNNDAETDRIGYRLNEDNPDGPFFQVIAVAKTPDSVLQHSNISIPYDTDEQISLCSMGNGTYNAPTVTHETWTAEELKKLGIPLSPHVIKIDDGMCDAIRLFWPADIKQEEVKFIPIRN